MMPVQTEICTIEKNGFNAYYYPGKLADDMAIISVGGASCDEKTSIAMSGFLRKAGYNVLVLGFYMWKEMSKNLVSIPIDYVGKAVDWLKNEKGIKKIVMTGASTGAGYTLVCASLIKEIGCVIPIVPFDYVMEGTTSSFKRLGRSVYTWHGKVLPFSPWTIIDKGIPKIFFEAVKDKKYGLSRFMRYGYDHNPVKEESRIKIENMHAAVLFLAVEDDDGWPSSEAVQRMVAVLREKNYPYRVESKIYENASHALTDGLEQMKGYAKWAFKHLLPAEKKYPEECEMARKDSFKRILTFIEEWRK